MTISALMSKVVQNGSGWIGFLRVPDAYYERLPERIGAIKEHLEKIGELGILVDRDDEGYPLIIHKDTDR